MGGYGLGSYGGRGYAGRSYTWRGQLSKTHFHDSGKRNAFLDVKLGWLNHHRYKFRYGAVLWPYFSSDYFSCAFWPSEYCDTFWGYDQDVILWGAFWPNGEFTYDDAVLKDVVPEGGVADTCKGFSDLTIQEFKQVTDASVEQREALNDLKAATTKASDILRRSCPSETPLTPASRLEAMHHRLKAVAEANEVIKGPLLHLYSLFTTIQKQRFEALARRQIARAKDVNVGNLCTGRSELASFPADQIASKIKLSDAQKQELGMVRAASAQASKALKASCPSSVPNTIDGRLEAAQKRVMALIQAVDTVRTPVRDFYASLTDEQKAAIGHSVGKANRV